MGILTAEMKEMVQNLHGYVATSSKDGVPNVSYKGTTRVVDDDTLAFACVMSDNTIANLKENPNIAISIANPEAMRGFQFKGVAQLEESGPLFEQITAEVTARKLPRPKCIARVTVKEVLPFPPGK
jgi:hypothetical protein